MMVPTRRGLIAGVLGTSLGVAMPSIAQPRAALNVADPRQRLRTFMLMRGALDERLVVSCISCRYFGVVDAVMTPFYDLEAVTFARFRQAKNGGYDAVGFEIEYFIDPQSGDVLDRWRNPYSGEVVTAKHTDSAPTKYAIGPDLRLGMPQLLVVGTQLTRQTPRFDQFGDDVWVEEKTTATIPVAGGRPMHFNESVTYHARASDIARPGVTRIAADVSYLGISSFRPWQAMGDRPGHIVGQGIGSSNMTMADVPPRWLAITRRRHPEALVDPAAYLEPLWKTL